MLHPHYLILGKHDLVVELDKLERLDEKSRTSCG